MWAGDLPAAASLAAESDSVGVATGRPFLPYTLLRLRALQGNEPELSALLETTSGLAVTKGQGVSTSRQWAAAVLWNRPGALRGGDERGQSGRLGLRHPEASDVGTARTRRGGRTQR